MNEMRYINEQNEHEKETQFHQIDTVWRSELAEEISKMQEIDSEATTVLRSQLQVINNEAVNYSSRYQSHVD